MQFQVGRLSFEQRDMAFLSIFTRPNQIMNAQHFIETDLFCAHGYRFDDAFVLFADPLPSYRGKHCEVLLLLVGIKLFSRDPKGKVLLPAISFISLSNFNR